MFKRKGLTRAQAVLGSAVLLLLVLGVPWGWEVWKEPRFEGHGIRYWIEQLPERFANTRQDRAMAYFGEGAVPYLIEATERPKKWHSGFLAKVPRRVVNRIVDLQRMDQVAVGAFQRLSELAQQETYRNELVPDPSYPVADQLIAAWKPQLQNGSSRELINWVGYLGPKVTNLAPELKEIWYQMNPSDDYWRPVTEFLSRTRDPSLTPALVQWSKSEKWVNVRPTPMTWVEVKSAAIGAMGWNGHVTDEVVGALRSGLQSSNEIVNLVTLGACYQLGVCMEEALAKIQEKRTESPWKSLDWAARSCESLEQVLCWRAKTNQLSAEGWIRANLSKPGPTLRLLYEAGPAAKEFAPEIAAIAKGSNESMRLLAIRVLWRIDPAEAEKVVRGGP